MFTDKQLDRYADVLLWGPKTARTARFKKNDVVALRYNLPAIRLAEMLYTKWLNSMNVKFYRIESAHADLEVTPGKHRKWIGISGRNIPSFEIFVSPDWHGT